MSTDYKNYGVAGVKVSILDALPNINTNPRMSSFDISAAAFDGLKRSPYFLPIFAEAIVDETFSAMMPVKRKYFVDNFIADSTGLSDFKKTNPNENAYITWKSTKKLPATTCLNKEIEQFKNTDMTSTGAGGNDYTPVWDDKYIQKPPDSIISDAIILAQWKSQMQNAVDSAEPYTAPATPEPSPTDPLDTLSVVRQSKVLDGMWWGAESNAFITPQMPFWVNIKKYDPPTSSLKLDTFLVVSLGLNDPENRFDLILSANNKPRLIEYVQKPDGGAADTGTGADAYTGDNGDGVSEGGDGASADSAATSGSDSPFVSKEWDDDRARILHNHQDIEIGFMAVAGRLIIYVNKEMLVYTRIDNTNAKGGQIREVKISAGGLGIYGTNMSATFHVCPMTFASEAFVSLPIPSLDQFAVGKTPLVWMGSDAMGNARGSVAELPTPPSVKKQLYGIDCKTFKYNGASISPTGIGFHKLGVIELKSAGNLPEYACLAGNDFYALSLQCEDGKMSGVNGEDVTVKNGGCPYYFRLKGLTSIDSYTSSPSPTDASDYVLSVNESANASDYYQFKRQLSVTLYNPNGIWTSAGSGSYGDPSAGINLTGKQHGIQISWGWNGQFSQTSFTGVITSYATSEKAGMETITLECQDYMFIMANSAILNSPYYDGMLISRAIMDVAKRSGCINPVIDWTNETENFLPSGFAYTQPRFHFRPNDMLLKIANDFAQMSQAYFFFDGAGKFHVAKIPGGLFSVQSSSSVKANFVQDPSAGPQDHVVLGEKNVTYDFSDTVSTICIFTLDRNTRNIIVVAQDAEHNSNRGNLVLYRRTLLINQPAYGAIEVARNFAKELGKRVYKPILKTNFKTVGFYSATLNPLDYITLNGQVFRIMGLKRSFSAESNDFTQEYECEWLGG